MPTYLKLSDMALGLLNNFHVPVLKDGIRRDVWHYKEKDNAEAQRITEHRREDMTGRAQLPPKENVPEPRT
jgi:hypothetical protein